MSLDNQILELIAVGASVAANCQTCLEYNIAKATEFGADHQQIAEAIEVGRRVRRSAAIKLDRFATHLNYGGAGDSQWDCHSASSPNQ